MKRDISVMAEKGHCCCVLSLAARLSNDAMV